jgi:hypothetical protein
MTIGILVPLVIVVAVLIRARGLFMRQPLVAASLQRRIAISIGAASIVVILGASSDGVLLADVAGVVVGALVGWLAARATLVDAGPGGRTYVPNRWFAAGILVLFVGRVIYRLIEVLPTLSSAAAIPPTNLFGDPITSALLVLTFAYYASYCATLLPLARRAG